MVSISKYKRGNLINNLLDDLYTNPIFDLWPVESKRNPYWTENTPMKFDTDLIENEKDYTMTAEIPGIEEKDLNITFENNILSIGYEKSSKVCSDSNKCQWQELKYGKYQRSFYIDNVDPNKISATISKGILTITLEKKEKMLPESKRIEVKSIE